MLNIPQQPKEKKTLNGKKLALGVAGVIAAGTLGAGALRYGKPALQKAQSAMATAKAVGRTGKQQRQVAAEVFKRNVRRGISNDFKAVKDKFSPKSNLSSAQLSHI